LVERFFNRVKQFRRIATRYEKLDCNFLAMIRGLSESTVRILLFV
jgi:transposase